MNKKVILISIDGLRPDAVETCGHPFVNTLRENGCYSPDASSVVPPVTLPAHTSIFYLPLEIIAQSAGNSEPLKNPQKIR